MPNFIVVQCGSCARFQVVQQPKSKKFGCRMCGEKNSVRRIYAGSTKASEVRPVCQRLNMRRGEREEEQQLAAHEDRNDKFGDVPEEGEYIDARHPTEEYREAGAFCPATRDLGGSDLDEPGKETFFTEEAAVTGGFWNQFRSSSPIQEEVEPEQDATPPAHFEPTSRQKKRSFHEYNKNDTRDIFHLGTASKPRFG
mmetsp:Transcript_8911/g.16417  ORF Transcript_8911/g.16417 Transcript_8911/m.16417 type:complete len:197 (+) Transcript_8911:109-699(+)|eukprot:CAMPEP_0184517956 /NCGR_PEP_ID=MMETSP0198_2-20121128/5832_1 /TAXON_ID=1112570 /ORGANISM="Thraustochytrium sp., Strain LLF1b" /LENGTH=196 /DNA_ID=CAMNT_0026908365 /DNA_START=94 /DNA_END=684 /DNA_ORIENTATION=+